MQKFRAAVRLAVIAALKDIGTVSHINTRMAYDCGGDPIDNPAFTVGSVQMSNSDCGGDWGNDPGQLGGGGFGGGGFDGGGYNRGGFGGGVGDWGLPSGPWTLQSFDDFANQMVDFDFATMMNDFQFQMQQKPKLSCVKFIEICKNACGTMQKIETGGCAALGGLAGALLNPGIGIAAGFYCAAKVELNALACTETCITPTPIQCDP